MFTTRRLNVQQQKVRENGQNIPDETKLMTQKPRGKGSPTQYLFYSTCKAGF